MLTKVKSSSVYNPVHLMSEASYDRRTRMPCICSWPSNQLLIHPAYFSNLEIKMVKDYVKGFVWVLSLLDCQGHTEWRGILLGQFWLLLSNKCAPGVGWGNSLGKSCSHDGEVEGGPAPHAAHRTQVGHSCFTAFHVDGISHSSLYN